MPSSRAITRDGNWPATSVTKSHSPRPRTASMMAPASAWTSAVHLAAWRGMNCLDTSARWAVCSGGSIISIIRWKNGSDPGDRSPIIMPSRLEYVP